MMNNLFENRALCIATKHGKECVISPAIQQLGVLPFTSNLIDTDSLGTFSGEIERTLSPIDAARQKCILANDLTGCDLVIASEGSFGAHPVVGFLPCDEELLLLCDYKNNLEIVVKEISPNTNFASSNITCLTELLSFAESSQFPSHGLIFKDENNKVIAKGITDWSTLTTLYNGAILKNRFIRVETDMRANFNPTRLSVIEQCAIKLVAAAKSKCPRCLSPGFIATEAIAGLPCSSCGLPTKSTLKHVRQCKVCGFADEKLFPHAKRFEDPSFCDFCNP